jgi:hypothetical protein
MTDIQSRAARSEAIARASIRALSDARLVETWELTESQPHSRKVTITRGWLLDELEQRMGRMDVAADLFPDRVADYDGDRFGAWLEAVFASPDVPVSPLPYLS